MSGSSLPYRLRPNKFIDRELFVDLINHLIPQRGASNYVYISMGGQHLIDHSIVYRRTGISNLYSFDISSETVKRQQFNRPLDTVICERLESTHLAGSLDRITSSFHEDANVIVWLDYTEPGGRLQQLQETVAVAKRLQPGDVLRVTFNANAGTLDEGGDTAAWKGAGAVGPGPYRCDRLREQVGDYLPAELKSIGDGEFPSALTRAVSLALSRASLESGSGLAFKPVLLTTYKDGQRMVTATVIVIDDEHPFRVDSQTWCFLPASWTNILEITAPDLSARERHKLDQELSKSPQDIHDELGFNLDAGQKRSIQAIESYRKFRRFYPSFHHTEA